MNYAPAALADEIVQTRLCVLYRLGPGDVLLESNEPGGHGDVAPIAHVTVGQRHVVFGLRAGLPESVTTPLLAALADVHPVYDLTDRTIERRIRTSVASIPLISGVSSGPCYSFPIDIGVPNAAVRVDDTNSNVLSAINPEVIGILSSVAPCYAILVDGSAVSLCKTSRVHGLYREAGVDTAEGYRRRGYGTAVVAGWARKLIAVGLRPLYSTDWDNYGSQGIASALHLELAAVDIKIE
jgi:hypothetical protein